MKKGRILLVEDEIELAHSLRLLLADDFEKIDVAYNGAEGLDLLAKEEYSLILSDILMPLMSGHEMIRQTRLRGTHTPVIFMTGNGTKDVVQAALKLGAVDFVDKPVSLSELQAVINATLEIEQHKRNIQDLKRDHTPNQTLIRNEELALGIKQVSRDKLIR